MSAEGRLPASDAAARLQFVCRVLDRVETEGAAAATPNGDDRPLPGPRCFEVLANILSPSRRRKHRALERVSMRDLWNLVSVLHLQFSQLLDPDCPVNAALTPDPFSTTDTEVKEALRGEIVAFVARTAKDFACSTPADPAGEGGSGRQGLIPSLFSSRGMWNMLWESCAFTCGGQPAYRLTARDGVTYYLYFRRGSRKWVIDDEVVPAGACYSVSSGLSLDGRWATSASWELNRDVLVARLDASTMQVRGCKGQPDNTSSGSCSVSENGSYKLDGRKINGREHYVLRSPELKGEERHLMWSTNEMCWKVTPTCTEEEGSFLKQMSGSERPTDQTWCSIPKDVVDEVRWETRQRPAGPPDHAKEEDAEGEETPIADAQASVVPWGELNHETFLFSNANHVVAFFSKRPVLLRSRMNPALVKFLEVNRVKVGETLDEEKATGNYYRLLGAFTGVHHTREEAELLLGDLATSFALTGDALLKMLAITYRVRCGIPCVLVGECGCGKTATIRYLAAWLRAELVLLDVHGGTAKADLVGALERAERLAADRDALVLLFLDEVNTCAHLGLIEEICVQRHCEGRRVDARVTALVALNPYRLRPARAAGERGGSDATYAQAVVDDGGAGLSLDEGAGGSNNNSGRDKSAPSSALVYLVHPVPRSLLDLAFDFGTLDPATESLYVRSMVESTLDRRGREDFPALHAEVTSESAYRDALAALVVAAQSHVRDAEHDPAAASLRDAQRCIDLCCFFLKLSQSRRVNANARLALSAAVLALAFAYAFRLPSRDARNLLWIRLSHCRELKEGGSSIRAFRELQDDPRAFSSIVSSAQMTFCSHLVVEEGVAMNEALSENVFVTIVCILNRIPVFLVGKPGTSKTLALSIAATNLQGPNSPSPFFRRWPSLALFTYQCSPLSTAVEIERQFQVACRYQAHSQEGQQLSVFVMDEVGLAELSPDLPLKVLHRLLVSPPVAVVGVSNWTLDRAKMNRAVLLSRPEPSVLDMRLTASKSLGSDAPWLKGVADAFHEVYLSQTRGREFFGMRDFFSLVKALRRLETERGTVRREDLVFAVCRNFGGKPAAIEGIVATFERAVWGA